MAFNFVGCDRDQELLLPPSLREWLAEDHLAWFVLDAVDAIELGAFYAEYRCDGWGRAAFDPGMMVALLLYAYAVGERSSRRIERRCREDVAFRVICANRVPDHATIARFRVRHEQALAATFTQVLVLCGRAGLVSVGVVALDGSPISGNASPGATRTYAAIREEVDTILRQAAETDAAEDEQLGDARGDELPAPLADRRSRLERLRRCRLELEREEAEAQAAYAAKLAWRAEWEAEHGRKLTGRKPAPPNLEGLGKRKANTTDPDTRMITRTGRRTVQGFNVQVVANPNQIVLAAEVTQSINDGEQLEPMVDRASSELLRAGINEPLDTVVADGGYWNAAQISAIRARQIDVLVPAKNRRRMRPRKNAPPQGHEARRMEAILDTPEGQARYRRRQQIVEPVFANIKYLRRIDRFQRRGLRACQAEWKLIAATHNLLKLWRVTLTGAPV